MFNRNSPRRPKQAEEHPFCDRHYSKGFTLVEVVIVLGLVAIVVAIMTPSLLSWQRGRELRDAARSVRTALEAARTKAVAQGNVYGVGFQASEGARDRFVPISLFDLADPGDNEYGKSYPLSDSIRFRAPLPGADVPNSGNPYINQDTDLPDIVGLAAFRTSGELESRYLGSTATDPEIVLEDTSNRSKTLTVNRITGKVTVT